MLALLPEEGYSSLSQVIASLVTDGNGGAFLALGGGSGAGAGIDFTGTSVSQLTTFLQSGTHIVFDTSFPNGWH